MGTTARQKLLAMKIQTTLADVSSRLKTKDKTEQLASIYTKTPAPMYRKLLIKNTLSPKSKVDKEAFNDKIRQAKELLTRENDV